MGPAWPHRRFVSSRVSSSHPGSSPPAPSLRMSSSRTVPSLKPPAHYSPLCIAFVVQSSSIVKDRCILRLVWASSQVWEGLEGAAMQGPPFVEKGIQTGNSGAVSAESRAVERLVGVDKGEERDGGLRRRRQHRSVLQVLQQPRLQDLVQQRQRDLWRWGLDVLGFRFSCSVVLQALQQTYQCCRIYLPMVHSKQSV